MQPTPRADALIGTARQALEALRRLAAWEGFVRSSYRASQIPHLHDRWQPHNPVAAHPRARAGRRAHIGIEAAQINADTGRALAIRRGRSGARASSRRLEAGFFQQTLFPQDWVCLVGRVTPAGSAEAHVRASYQAEEHIGITSGTGQLLSPARALARSWNGSRWAVAAGLPRAAGDRRHHRSDRHAAASHRRDAGGLLRPARPAMPVSEFRASPSSSTGTHVFTMMPPTDGCEGCALNCFNRVSALKRRHNCI